MPRIAPLQLINCLSVLLTPSGGIKSQDEVSRLVLLMKRFSLKLVSRCVYVSILKSTKQEVLADFMDNGGWALVYQWLEDSVTDNNWMLIKEILELLYICPVDVKRLRLNNIPKVVKSLSKNKDIEGVREIAGKIVLKWVAVVKGLPLPEDPFLPSTDSNTDPVSDSSLPAIKITIKKEVKSEPPEDVIGSDCDETEEKSSSKKIKERVKRPGENNDGYKTSSSKDSRSHDKRSTSDKHKSNDKERHKSSSDRHRTSHSDKYSSSSRSKDKSKSTSREEREKEKSKASSNKTYLQKKEREKERDRTHKEKDKKDKEKLTKIEKDRQIETDQATLARLMVPSINKLGKIPKKSDKIKSEDIKTEEKKETKKTISPAPPLDVPKKNISFSIEKRTPSDQKPKTVKTFNAKFRSTGLEEESKPPPPVRSKTSTKPLKRTSPVKDLLHTEKNPKIEHRSVPALQVTIPPAPYSTDNKTDAASPTEKNKITPPKPKVIKLQESDVFSDALNDATLVKETKKKKRKLSTSKDDVKEKITSPTQKLPEDNKPTFKFYRDTLDSTLEESKKRDEREKEEKDNETAALNEPIDSSSPVQDDAQTPCTSPIPQQSVEKCNIAILSRPPDKPLTGILTYLKSSKRVKKSVQWRAPNDNFEDVFYFELDETERCNVARPSSFTDMRSMERGLEREHFHTARKLAHEDRQVEKTHWRKLVPFDLPKSNVIPGKFSQEKEIQYARELAIEPAIYYNSLMIPPTPAEPDFEVYPTTDPIIIPLEDEADPNNIIDFSKVPWPEPKQFLSDVFPQQSPNYNSGSLDNPAMNMMPGVFPGNMPPPNGPFPNNWMGGVVDMPAGSIPPMGGMPPNMPFPPGMGPPGIGPGPGSIPGPNGPVPPMGMNMGMMGPMPPEMMMNNPMGPFPPMGPPGMFGPGPGFNGPPGPWFGPGGPGSGPNDGPHNMNMDMNTDRNMNDNKHNKFSNKPSSSSRHKSSSGGSWKRGPIEPSRGKSGRPHERRDRSTIPCRNKSYCTHRDCPYMHPPRNRSSRK